MEGGLKMAEAITASLIKNYSDILGNYSREQLNAAAHVWDKTLPRVRKGLRLCGQDMAFDCEYSCMYKKNTKCENNCIAKKTIDSCKSLSPPQQKNILFFMAYYLLLQEASLTDQEKQEMSKALIIELKNLQNRKKTEV